MPPNYTLIKSYRDIEGQETKKRCHRYHYTLGAVICFITLLTFLATNHTKKPTHKRNVILMISDGFGPAAETFARQYYNFKHNTSIVFPLDKILVGTSRTQSSSSLITDSAAGATAFACALKSYNGAIGVDSDKIPCGTVLESAKIHRHMQTGLVVKSRITHATPASFNAHIEWRDWENSIAEHQLGYTPLGRTVDLMFGGGLCEFKSNTTDESCRFDERNLINEAQENFGWKVITTKKEMQEEHETPLLGLFASQHMDFALDRDEAQPSLVEMTERALEILSEAKNGFFLMVEGSRIDMAAHVNDPAAQVQEIWEYQQTVDAVMKYIDKNPGTILVSTSDHETGGLTVGRQVTDTYPEYEWKPEVIERVRNSSEILSWKWLAAIQEGEDTEEYLLDEIIGKGLGINDTTQEEFDRLWKWKETSTTTDFFATTLSDLVSKRAQIGWTTMGHTAVDVNLYAYGHGTETLKANHENTDIGDFIVEYLGLNLNDITERLKKDKEFVTKELEKKSRLTKSKHDLFVDH